MLFKALNSSLLPAVYHVLAKTEVGQAVDELWNSIYTVIKEIGGTLAIATFVCSAFYYFILGSSKTGLDTAKKMMVGSGIGIAIIYLAPLVINAIIEVVSKIG